MSQTKEKQAPAANPLGTEPVGKLMLKFAVPSIISLVVNSIYNMVDQLFIGQGVGYLGNAATNVISPIMTAVVAIALLIGDGAAAYMSLQMGRGKPDEASHGAGNAMALIVIVGVVLTVLVSIFIKPLCWMLGATETNISYCLGYGSIIALGIIASMIDTAFGSILRADGRPNLTMIGLLIGCGTNIILDPVFIFLCGWGVKGAALATILGQYFNAIFYLICCTSFKTIKLKKSYFVPKARICGKTLSLGVSSFISQAAGVAVMVVMNNLLVVYGEQSAYGPDIPLAVMGIVLKFNMLLNSFFIGIGSGCQPIFGYNYGSGQYDRVKEVLKRSLIIGEIISIIGLIIFQVFPEQLISLYGQESELYVEFAVKCFRIHLLCCFMVPFVSIISIFFQSIGKPIRAAFISLSRQILFFIPMAFILGALFGIDGLLWTGPVSDTAAGAVAIIILIVSWKKLFRKEGVQNGQ